MLTMRPVMCLPLLSRQKGRQQALTASRYSRVMGLGTCDCPRNEQKPTAAATQEAGGECSACFICCSLSLSASSSRGVALALAARCLFRCGSGRCVPVFRPSSVTTRLPSVEDVVR